MIQQSHSSVYIQKNYNLKQIHTPAMFIATLFIIAKTWQRPKFPWTEEQIKKMVHIYNGVLLSHKKEWNNAICSNMDGTRGYPTKWCKSETERQIAYIIYMCNLKYDTSELIYEIETDSQTYRADLWLPRESVGGGGMDWEFEISRCKLLYILQKNWIIWLYTRN